MPSRLVSSSTRAGASAAGATATTTTGSSKTVAAAGAAAALVIGLALAQQNKAHADSAPADSTSAFGGGVPPPQAPSTGGDFGAGAAGLSEFAPTGAGPVTITGKKTKKKAGGPKKTGAGSGAGGRGGAGGASDYELPPVDVKAPAFSDVAQGIRPLTDLQTFNGLDIKLGHSPLPAPKTHEEAANRTKEFQILHHLQMGSPSSKEEESSASYDLTGVVALNQGKTTIQTKFDAMSGVDGHVRHKYGADLFERNGRPFSQFESAVNFHVRILPPPFTPSP